MATTPCLDFDPVARNAPMSRALWLHNETLPEVVSDDEISGDVTAADAMAYNVYTIIMEYVAPVLIMFGSTGNLLSLAVLQSRFFRKSPSAFILSVLALTDTGVLLCGLLRHWVLQLTHDQVDLRSFNIVTCYVHSLFTYYLCQLSSWSLVLVTMERMVSIKWPLRCREYFSKKRMIGAWTSIALILAAINGHWFVTVGLVQQADDSGVYRCRMLEEYYWFSLLVWPWLDLVILSVIPLVIIITCNINVINALIRASRQRRRMSEQKIRNQSDSNAQITVMLIGLNIIFFVTTLPVSIYFIGENTFWDPEQPSTRIAYAVCNITYYLSNSTNFLVYCVMGSKFRRALFSIVCCTQTTSKSGKSAKQSSQPYPSISDSFSNTAGTGNSSVTLVSVISNA